MMHTPTPWKLYHEVFRPALSQMKIIEVQDENGKSIVFWTGFDSAPQSREVVLANAAFIVRACNVYEELVEAAKELLDSLEDVGICCHDVIKTARLGAALSKAEGKP